jgi:hypothetical protein
MTLNLNSSNPLSERWRTGLDVSTVDSNPPFLAITCVSPRRLALRFQALSEGPAWAGPDNAKGPEDHAWCCEAGRP